MEERSNEEILKLLKDLISGNENDSQIKALVEQIRLETTEFESKHLVQICKYCLGCIQSKNATHVIKWKDLLPNVLRVLSERDSFEVNDLVYTGEEYKSDFINTLCMNDWSVNIVTSLAAMFTDMPLSKEEHLKVVVKLGSYIENMTPQELPPFTYQLLRLCRNQNSRLVFAKLQHYFGLRIYKGANNFNRSESSSESPDLNLIESTDNHDVLEAESTILYHIHSVASFGDNSIKDYLNSLKNLQKSPEFVLQPFQLMVLFNISTVKHYKESVFELIRPCIARCYVENQKKSNSCWYRELVVTRCSPEDIFNQVILASLENHEVLLESIVYFAFELLSVFSFLGRDPISEKQWNLGIMILLKIIKRKRHIASIIIKTFSRHIVNRQSATQYNDCLYKITKSMPLMMLENQGSVVELMERLVHVSATVADQLLDALIPLTRVSSSIRDQLILVLRKCLYSGKVDTRLIAVNGFLKLMSSMKISGLGSLSQTSGGSFSSGNSLFTQISLNRTTQNSVTFSNEATCLEILTVLKRCFMQQWEVRAKLYKGLYGAVCMNPELSVPVLDALWFHLRDYWETDGHSLPPLKFNKIANLRDTDSVLQEPLGQLIYSASLILTKVSDSEEDKDNPIVITFTNFMETLCEQMPQCELVHFELDDGTDLTDILPESQQKSHILKEAMNVYEALIGYKICSWNINSQKYGQNVNNLYQGYSRLSQLAKNSSKPKKGKKNPNKTTQQAADANANSSKKSEGQKSSKGFQLPNTIWNYQAVERALQLLHEPNVPWAKNADTTVVKTKKDIHRHILQAAIHLVNKGKHFKTINEEQRKICYDHVTNIAKIVYQRVIVNLTSFIDFDCTSEILALECFHTILIVVNGQFKSNLNGFLRKVGEQDEKGDLVTALTPFVEQYQKLFKMDDEDHSPQDSEIKKLSLVVMNTLSTLVSFIPANSNALAIQVLDWLKHFAYDNTVTSKVSSSFMSLFFEMHVKYKTSLSIMEEMSACVSSVIGIFKELEKDKDELEADAAKFKVINEATANNTVFCLCANVKSILEDIDAVIARLKSEYYMIIYPGEDDIERRKESIKVKEKGVSCELYFVVTIMTNLCTISLQPGNMLEAVLKSITLLFKTLAVYTKYFMTKSTKNTLGFQGTSFERLVKIAGKQLAPLVYDLILYIEESQKEEAQPTQNKKKPIESTTMKSKVLRDTRQIPKIIFEIEQFSKSVIQLSNKTKFDLSKYVGQGTVRDFRILQLKDVLEQAGDTSVLTNTQNSTVNSTRDTERSGSDSEHDEDAESPPPTKRSRAR